MTHHNGSGFSVGSPSSCSPYASREATAPIESWLHSQAPLGLPKNASDVIGWHPLEDWQVLGRLGPGPYGTCMALFSGTRGNTEEDSLEDSLDCWSILSKFLQAQGVWLPMPRDHLRHCACPTTALSQGACNWRPFSYSFSLLLPEPRWQKMWHVVCLLWFLSTTAYHVVQIQKNSTNPN